MDKESMTQPMTVLENMLKDCLQQRPDIQDHILSPEELTSYISWMARSFGHTTELKASTLPVRPSTPQMSHIANRLLSDPTDDAAISQLSSGYNMQSEDRHFLSDHDISVSRMLR